GRKRTRRDRRRSAPRKNPRTSTTTCRNPPHHRAGEGGGPSRLPFSGTRGEPVKRFYLESYGCQMNVYDTQGLERLLEDHGFARVGEPEAADVVLVNTCSVREHAEERTLNRLA